MFDYVQFRRQDKFDRPSTLPLEQLMSANRSSEHFRVHPSLLPSFVMSGR